VKEYIFHLKVEGHGETKEAAWEQAKASIGQSDLTPDEVEIFGERWATVIGWDEDEPQEPDDAGDDNAPIQLPSWLEEELDKLEGV
jgi:hypothetical protein